LNEIIFTFSRIFIPSFKHALELVGQKMALLNLAEKELCALIGIVLFDPSEFGWLREYAISPFQMFLN
jgi:hypothetical protein